MKRMIEYQKMRKYKRHKLSIESHIRSINHKEENNLKRAKIKVYDISLGGIGFKSNVKLTKKYFYRLKLKLWGTTELNTIIEIVRSENDDINFDYGAVFIGLSDYEKWLINSYCILHNHD